MSGQVDQERRPLNERRSKTSHSIELPATSVSTPKTPQTRHRPGYARIPSVSFAGEDANRSDMNLAGDDDNGYEARDTGLGIDMNSIPARTSRVDFSPADRRTTGARTTPAQQTPDSGRAFDSPPSTRNLLSPPSTGGLSGSTRYDETLGEWETSYKGPKHSSKPSASSLRSVQNSSPLSCPGSERGLLHKHTTASMREQYDDFSSRHGHVCNSSRHFSRSMNNALAITIISLSIFSTVFSAIFVIIGLRGPRYHQWIGTDGVLTVSTAAFLTTLFAKMIELSFITVVVAFVGQVLARRAYRKDAYPGVTLAEMSMRNWIMQPGTMFTHWESVRYALPSVLGVISLIAAIMAILYTSAATALVQPQLKFSKSDHKVMQGQVLTEFANPNYIQQNCKTPISTLQDDELDISDTCFSIEEASQAYHNYQHWLSTWTDYAFIGNGSSDLSERPPGWALWNDNTTITAPWIEQNNTNMTKWYLETGWVVNNVTMAMPHAGVVTAALNSQNGIMQPDELNGLGIYSIRASVPVPFINVICAMNLDNDTLKPLINGFGWKDTTDGTGTRLDDVFQWGPNYGLQKWPPVFAQYPSDYNTFVNDTTNLTSYGRVAIYVIGKGGPTDQVGGPTTSNYALCELRVGQTPACSTRYNASSNVATLEAICEDPNDDLQYIKSLNNATSGNASVTTEWPNIGSVWAHSISLNDGYFSGNGSNARLWTELILTNTSSVDPITGMPVLSKALPSPAEALSVMAGCTLLQSSQDAPFVPFFNYSADRQILEAPGQTQYFNASIRAQEYASGGTSSYQRAFGIVLFIVFIINVIVLIYFVVHRQWYRDFSDPIDLFGLAINSPPSEKLAECNEKRGEQFRHYWRLGSEGGHMYMESPDMNEADDGNPRTRRKRFSERFEMVTSPLARMTERRRRKT